MMGCCFSKEPNPNLISERTGLLQSTVPDGSPIKEGTREHARALAGLGDSKLSENGSKLICVDTTRNMTKADLSTRLGRNEKCGSSNVQNGSLLLTESVVCDTSVNKPRSTDERGTVGSREKNLERTAKDIKLIRPQIKPCTERVMSNSVKRKIAENAVMRANWFKEASPSGSLCMPDMSFKTSLGQLPSVSTGVLNFGEVSSQNAIVESLQQNGVLKAVCEVTTEALQTGTGKSSDVSTVGAYVSSLSKVSDIGEKCNAGDGGLSVDVALEQGFKTRTHSFYSICTIDSDDLEGETVTQVQTVVEMDRAPLTVTVGGGTSPSLEAQLSTPCPVKASVPLDCQPCSNMHVETSIPLCSKSAPLLSVSQNDEPALPDLIQTFLYKEAVCKPSSFEDGDPLPCQDTQNEVLTDQSELKDHSPLLPGRCLSGALMEVTEEATPDLLEGKEQISACNLGGEEPQPVMEPSGLHPVNQHASTSVYEVSDYEHAQQPQCTPGLNVQQDSVYTAHMPQTTRRDLQAEMPCHLKVEFGLEDDVLAKTSICPVEVVDVNLEGSRLPLDTVATGASIKCGEMLQSCSLIVAISNKDENLELLCDNNFDLDEVVPKPDIPMSEMVSEMSGKQIQTDSANTSSVGHITNRKTSTEESNYHTLEDFTQSTTIVNAEMEQTSRVHSQFAESESVNDSSDLTDDSMEELISLKLKQYENSDRQISCSAPSEFISECIDASSPLSLVNSQSLRCGELLESSPDNPIVENETRETLECDKLDVSDDAVEEHLSFNSEQYEHSDSQCISSAQELFSQYANEDSLLSPENPFNSKKFVCGELLISGPQKPIVPIESEETLENSFVFDKGIGNIPTCVLNLDEVKDSMSLSRLVDEQHSELYISDKCKDFGDLSNSTAYPTDLSPKALLHPIESTEKYDCSESLLLNNTPPQLERTNKLALEEKKCLVLEQVSPSSVLSTDTSQLNNMSLVSAEDPTILKKSIEVFSIADQSSEKECLHQCKSVSAEETSKMDSEGIQCLTPCIEPEPVDLNQSANIVSEPPQMLMLGNLFSQDLSKSMVMSNTFADGDGSSLDESPGGQCALSETDMPDLPVPPKGMCLPEDGLEENNFCLSDKLPITMSSSLVEMSPVQQCGMLSHPGLLGLGEGDEVDEDELRTLPVSCTSQPIKHDERWSAAIYENAIAKSPATDALKGPPQASDDSLHMASRVTMQTEWEVSGPLAQDVITDKFSPPFVSKVEPDQVDANATMPSYEIHLLSGDAFEAPPETAASTDESEGEQGMLNLICNLLEKYDFGEDTDASQYPSVWSQENPATLCSDLGSGCVVETAWERGLANMPPREDGEEATEDELKTFQAFMAAHPYSLLALDGTCVWDWQGAYDDLVSISS